MRHCRSADTTVMGLAVASGDKFDYIKDDHVNGLLSYYRCVHDTRWEC
jgi:hypothetical protein